MAKQRDPQNPPKKKARDDSSALAVVFSVEQRTLTCDTTRKSGRGGAEQIQDVSAFLRCCPRPDADSATDFALEQMMAHTDKCGNVTNEEGPTATARKMMDVVDWCFQQTKRTRRRKRSRPVDTLPERLVHRDDLVKTVLEGRSRTVRCWACQLSGSFELSWSETSSCRQANSRV